MKYRIILFIFGIVVIAKTRSQANTLNDRTDTGVLNAPITITAPEGETVTVTIESVDNKYVITVKSDVPQEGLDKTKDYVLELEATATGVDDKELNTLVITLPKVLPTHIPKFSQPYYTAIYQVIEDGYDQVVVNEPIQISAPGDATVEVAIATSPNSEYFSISPRPYNNYVITVQENLPEDIVNEGEDLVLTLEAIAAEAPEARELSVIIITLPKVVSSEIPSFLKNYYTATYLVNEERYDTIVMNDGNIQISAPDGEDVHVAFAENYEDNFGVDCKNTICTLQLTKNLPNNILNTKSEIVVILEASQSEDSVKSTATVIVSLPSNDPSTSPHFTESIYTATYEEIDGGDGVALDSPQIIKIAEVDDATQAVLTLTGEFNDYFTLTANGDHWDLSVKDNLPPTLVDVEVLILFTITAQVRGFTNEAEAGMVVKLPKKVSTPSIEFQDYVYMADYVNGNPDTITTEEDIIIIGDPISAARVILIGDYKDYFNVAYDGEKVAITLKSALPNDVQTKNSVIVLIIDAIKEADLISATLIVRFPPVKVSISPQFTETVYSATYETIDGTDEVTLDSPQIIKIEGVEDATQADLTITGDDSDIFVLKPNGDHWDLSLKDNLPSNLFEDEVSILLTITAQLPDFVNEVKAGLVVKLPKKVSLPSIAFADNVYMADYVKGSPDTIDVLEDIVISGDPLGVAKVILTGDYKDNFAVAYDAGKVIVTLKLPLLDDSAIAVTIEATEGSDVIIATLVVKFPPV